MSKLLRVSTVSVISAVLVTLLSSSAHAAPTSPAPQSQSSQYLWGCGCLCGRVVFPSDANPAPGTEVQMILWENTTEFVPHVAEWKIYSWDSSYEIPFQLGYDSNQINPDREYVLSAAVRDENGSVVFASNDYTDNKVITFGHKTSDITIQLERVVPIP